MSTRVAVAVGALTLGLAALTGWAWGSEPSTGGEVEPAPVTDGATLFMAKGCATCHDGPESSALLPAGPPLADVATWAGDRRPGLSAEEYVRESITAPGVLRVAGLRPHRSGGRHAGHRGVPSRGGRARPLPAERALTGAAAEGSGQAGRARQCEGCLPDKIMLSTAPTGPTLTAMAGEGPVLSHRVYRPERHGRWSSGAARAAVFGMSDGLVSNLSLVAGVAGASAVRADVVVVGLAGLVAGALSMAVGEYVSVRANQELLAARAGHRARGDRARPSGRDAGAGRHLRRAGARSGHGHGRWPAR